MWREVRNVVVYVSNAFALGMIAQREVVEVERIDLEKLGEELQQQQNVICAIGHPSTAKLLNSLLNTQYNCERKQINLQKGDILYTIVLSFRPPEGKVYSTEELMQLYEQGKISFYRVRVLIPYTIECVTI